MTQHRSRTADFLKGVALMAMVQVVLTEFFATDTVLNSIVGKISMFFGGAPAAPVFLAIMGYYIADTGKPFLKMIVRGIKLMLLGFAVNAGRNAPQLYDILAGTLNDDPLKYIFGVDILILAGLSVIAMALVIRVFDGHVLLYVGLILVFLFLQYIIPPVEKYYPDSYLLPYFYGKYPGAYFPFIPWFAYVLAGFVFYQIKHFFLAESFKHNHKVKVVLVVLSGLLLLVSLPFGFNVTIRPQYFAHHGLLFFLFCVNFLFWWLLSARAIVERVDNLVTRYLEWAGRNVTVFYVVFMILSGNFSAWQKKGDLMWLLVVFAGMVGLTTFIVWIYENQVKKRFGKESMTR